MKVKGYVPVVPISLESKYNNSTTPLSGGGTFTGQKELNPLPSAMASCFSDTDGTLFFDFSINGVDWRTFPSGGFDVTGGIHEFHVAVKGPRWFRCRFVNGSSAQSTFQLSIFFGSFEKPNAPLNQPLGLDADAILTRSTFPWLDLSRGLVSGMQGIKKFGGATVTTAFTPICGGGAYQMPTAAQSLELVSDASTDAQNGAGAREITIVGLDALWNEQTVTVSTHATDGTIAVAVSGTWLRVYRAFVSESGTYATFAAGSQSHDGEITIRGSGGGVTWARIPVDNSFHLGQSLIGGYTIPTGKSGYAWLNDISVEAGKTVTAGFFVRDNADDVTTPYGGLRVQKLLRGLTSGTPFNISGGQTPLGKYTGW